MLSDLYDLPISTSSSAAQAAYNSGVHKLLGAEAGMSAPFHTAIEADDGFALAHAGLARASMFAGDMALAASSIARAQSVSAGTTAREQSHINALSLMISGQGPQAYAAIRSHMQDHPRDAVIAQTCSSVFGLIGFSGQPGREAETLAYVAGLVPHYGADDWWIQSQYAFALCETGNLDAASTLIDKSLASNARNANAAHVRSHISYETGARAEGRAFLENWLLSYDRSGMLHGHLSWHTALWALYDGEVETMWARVDDAVSPTGSTHSLPINVLTDTASILHRAEAMGVAVPAERWVQISEFAAAKFPNAGNAFVDVHAALAHAMAGNTDALQRIITHPAGPAADLVPDLACGYRLLVDQDWAGATRSMTRAMGQLERIGGSRAQRDLVEHSLALALMRQGRAEEAQRLITLRRPVLSDAVAA